MAKFVVQGGIPLRGTFRVAGAKNAALKMIAAACLTSDEVVINNVPRISDAEVMLEALQFLGAEACWTGKHQVAIQAEEVNTLALPIEIASRCRSTFLLLGALLSRFGEATLPNPGGDKIGRRPVERHIRGLKEIGFKVGSKDGFYEVSGKSHDAHFEFKQNTHTGTENLILAAALGRGKVVLKNAACEPEIDDLIAMLNFMGAKIKRTEPRVVEIQGVGKLNGVEYTSMGDRNEAATLAVAAAVTEGEVQLEGIDPRHLTAFLSKLEEVGINFKVGGRKITVWSQEGQALNPVNIRTAPHPGFMTDWVPPFAVLLTQAGGISIIHETIFPNRLGYMNELKKMGAEIRLFNPEIEDPSTIYNFNLRDDRPEHFHAAEIFGSTPLRGTKVDTSDIRAGAALLVAALTAKGQSELSGVWHIQRGYENLPERLKELGAEIKVVE